MPKALVALRSSAVVISLLGISLAPPVSAQDRCDAVLVNQVVDRLEETTNATELATLAAYSCSHDYEEVKKTISASADVDIYAGLYGGSGNFTQGDFRQWKRENCNDRTTEEYQSAFRHTAQSTVQSGTVDAWRDCMVNRRGLTCWTEPHGRDIHLVINWKDPSTDLPIVVDSKLTGNAHINNTKEILPKDTTIFLGERVISIERTSPNEPVSLTMNALWDNRVMYPCRAFVPGDFAELANRLDRSGLSRVSIPSPPFLLVPSNSSIRSENDINERTPICVAGAGHGMQQAEDLFRRSYGQVRFPARRTSVLRGGDIAEAQFGEDCDGVLVYRNYGTNWIDKRYMTLEEVVDVQVKYLKSKGLGYTFIPLAKMQRDIKQMGLVFDQEDEKELMRN